MTDTISPFTRIGAVALTVSNLERSLQFYQDELGFAVLDSQKSSARLGLAGRALIYLSERPEARRYPRTTGLYHFAILTPSRLELAKILQHLAEIETPIEGVADHSVSEALYLSDPDDNGIEIYRDRPQSEWTREADGSLHMGTDPLDLDGLMNELSGESKGQAQAWNGLHPDTRIGHMHLHVSSLPEAEHFYTEVLGFSLMARMGATASFVSAGGYHHHIGLNTWVGVSAPPQPVGAIGMRYFSIHLPDAAALEQAAERIHQAGLPLQEAGSEGFPEDFLSKGLLVRDPSQNALILEY
ncbi:MAG: VOC family protein [Anaerolineaceae bacterium]|nr:VOC family protein [Anaerolineaceae bacterium]